MFGLLAFALVLGGCLWLVLCRFCCDTCIDCSLLCRVWGLVGCCVGVCCVFVFRTLLLFECCSYLVVGWLLWYSLLGCLLVTVCAGVVCLWLLLCGFVVLLACGGVVVDLAYGFDLVCWCDAVYFTSWFAFGGLMFC